MSSMIKSLCALVVAVGVLSGCQTVGNGQAMNIKPDESSPQLQIGTSTKGAVATALGVGSVYHLANGYEVWTYQKTSGVPKFVNYIPIVGLLTPSVPDRTTELALLFGPDGVLRNIDWRGQYQ